MFGISVGFLNGYLELMIWKRIGRQRGQESKHFCQRTIRYYASSRKQVLFVYETRVLALVDGQDDESAYSSFHMASDFSEMGVPQVPCGLMSA